MLAFHFLQATGQAMDHSRLDKQQNLFGSTTSMLLAMNMCDSR
jgi:hypothetical protein